jgi:hypothetical protein
MAAKNHEGTTISIDSGLLEDGQILITSIESSKIFETLLHRAAQMAINLFHFKQGRKTV